MSASDRTVSSNERAPISAGASELMMELFNRMPIEALKSVPEPIAKRLGDFMVANGYRIVFYRWYLQAEPHAHETCEHPASTRVAAWRCDVCGKCHQVDPWIPKPVSQCTCGCTPHSYGCGSLKADERREYHANGTYWSGVPTVDMPCDFCHLAITAHDPRTHACPTVSEGDQR